MFEKTKQELNHQPEEVLVENFDINQGQKNEESLERKIDTYSFSYAFNHIRESEMLFPKRVESQFREAELLWASDEAQLLELADRISLPPEKIHTMMEEFFEERDLILSEEWKNKEGFLTRLNTLIRESKAAIAASVLVLASEISGCMSMIERNKDFLVDNQSIELARNNSEEWKFLKNVVREEARNNTKEIGYIYGVDARGRLIGLREGRSESSASSGDSIRFNFDLDVLDKATKLDNIHTHPEKVLTPELIKNITGDEIDMDTLNKAKESPEYSMPPSAGDILSIALGINLDKMLSGSGRHINARVVDSGGVWTYTLNVEHPFIKHMLLYGKEMQQVIKDVLYKNHIEFEESKLADRGYVAALFQDIIHNTEDDHAIQEIASLLSTVEKENAESWANEYTERQLNIMEDSSPSKEKRDQFIRWNAQYGVNLVYEPFDEK